MTGYIYILTNPSIAGPQYFKYKGEWLNVLRARLEGRE